MNLTIAGFHDKVPSNAYMRYLADRTDEPILTSRTPTNAAFPTKKQVFRYGSVLRKNLSPLSSFSRNSPSATG